MRTTRWRRPASLPLANARTRRPYSTLRYTGAPFRDETAGRRIQGLLMMVAACGHERRGGAITQRT